MDEATVERVEARGPWAEPWGYSRALRCGALVEVSGTTAVDSDGTVLAEGDVYGQTREALQAVGRALAELGGSMANVVRTRVFLRDIAQWSEAGKAHREVFAEIRPVSTCVGGLDFLLPEILVEVEATAVLDPAETGTSA